MTIKDKVTTVVENSFKYRELNVGEEVWNILYNILHDLNIRHSDNFDDKNEELVGYIESYEMNYIHHFPHKIIK